MRLVSSPVPNLALLIAVVAACSSSDRKSAGSSDAGTVASSDAGATPPPPAPPTGTILVDWRGGQIAATAFFSDAAPTADPCERTTVGPCQIVSCPGAGHTPDRTLASAGTLTVSGGSAPVVLQPSQLLSGQYEIVSGDDASFEDGASVGASATGDRVPAFTAPAIPVPEAIVVSGDRPSIDFSKDFPVAWVDGGPHGNVVVEIVTDGGDRNVHLSCTFDATAHQAIVPAAALAHLPDCPSGQECLWLVQPKSTVHFTAGDYGIDFTVVADGATGQFEQQHDPKAGTKPEEPSPM